MMKKLAVLVAAGLFAAGAWGGKVGEIVPGTVNFQAKLARTEDGASVPLTGIQHVAFRLYDAEQGGALLWAREFPVTCTSEGMFNLVLSDSGSKLGNPAEEKLVDAFQGTERWFELEVEGYGTLVPRLRVTSAPYAFQSQYALWGEGGFTAAGDFRVAGDAEFSGNFTAGSGTLAELSVAQGGGSFGSVTVDGDVTVAAGKPMEGLGVIPVGGILMWAQETVPDGWAVCDGENGTPDLRGLFVRGADSAYGVGATGGVARVTLSVDQIPSHTHTYTFPSGEGQGSVLVRNNSGHIWRYEKDATTESAGGGGAHENRPPFFALYFIMRVR
jgi:microcystin-dependent protein